MAIVNKRVSISAALVSTAIAIAAPVILHFEGTVRHTYVDPVGIVSACTGHTGPELHLGEQFTQEQCATMLNGDIATASHGVEDCVTSVMSANELAAFTSFAFNEGVGAFCRSTIVKKLNSGDHAGACAQLSLWTMAGGKVLPGLVQRRAAERALCESPVVSAPSSASGAIKTPSLSS